MQRDSPTDRERGLTVLTQLRDMCLHEHWALSEVPMIEAFIAWEQGRRGELDGAIAASRAAVDDLFNAGQLAWCIPPTRVFVETLLARGGEADLQEAEAAIERLAAAPADEGRPEISFSAAPNFGYLARPQPCLREGDGGSEPVGPAAHHQ
jgi:hypothetical protein